MYYNGKGVTKDYVEAMKWHCRSANQGHGGSQFNLGVMYYNGEGVTKDYVEAYKWFSISGVVENRETVAALMTPKQIAEGKKRASTFAPHKEKSSSR